MSYRKKIAKDKPLVIDIDSTSHVQHGSKMEGLAWNYKKEWCLDSIIAFDEVGLCHGMKLRPQAIPLVVWTQYRCLRIAHEV
jgi:hypothetical protein